MKLQQILNGAKEKLKGIFSPIINPLGRYGTQVSGGVLQFLNPWLARFRSWWQERETREQRILLSGFWFIVCLLLWLLVLEPTYRGRDRALKQIPILQQQLTEISRLIPVVQSYRSEQVQWATPTELLSFFQSTQAQVAFGEGHSEQNWVFIFSDASWDLVYRNLKIVLEKDPKLILHEFKLTKTAEDRLTIEIRLTREE
jgi:hypothetical protein